MTLPKRDLRSAARPAAPRARRPGEPSSGAVSLEVWPVKIGSPGVGAAAPFSVVTLTATLRSPRAGARPRPAESTPRPCAHRIPPANREADVLFLPLAD